MKKFAAGLAVLALFAAAPALSKPKKSKGAAEATPATAAEVPAEAVEEAPKPEVEEPVVAPELLNPIKFRHTQMKLAGGHLKSIKLVVKGYDTAADQVLGHATALEAIAADMGDHWPAGSGHETGLEDMEAKAEIWTDAQGFAAELTKFQEATTALRAAAEGDDMDAIGQALGGVGDTCGSCHDVYRD